MTDLMYIKALVDVCAVLLVSIVKVWLIGNESARVARQGGDVPQGER